MWQYLKNCLCFGWRKWGVLELLGNRWNEVSFFCLLWGRNGGTEILTTHKGGVLKAPGLLILFGEDGDVICCRPWWEPPCLQGPKSFYILFGRGWRYKSLPPMRWINMPSIWWPIMKSISMLWSGPLLSPFRRVEAEGLLHSPWNELACR